MTSNLVTLKVARKMLMAWFVLNKKKTSKWQIGFSERGDSKRLKPLLTIVWAAPGYQGTEEERKH